MNLLHDFHFSQILSLLFVLLNVYDGHSTYLVVRPDHYHREKNPLARWIFRKVGLLWGILLSKSVLLALLLYLIFTQYVQEPLTLSIVLLVANAFFLWVVLHNYRVYRRIRE